MPRLAIVAFALAASVFVARAPIRYGLAGLVGVTLLVPGSLIVPNGLTALPTVGRVVLLVFAFSIIIRVRRGEIGPDVFRLTPVHVAFVAFLLVALVNGAFLAIDATGTGRPLLSWLGYVDQFVFFVVVLAAIRATDDTRWVAGMIGVLLMATVGIAFGEHYTGWSWSRFWFSGDPAQAGTVASFPLGTRGGKVRVQAGAEFSLEYGWMVVVLFPLLVARVVRSHPLITILAPAAAALAAYWTFARTAVLGMAALLLLLWLTSRVDLRVGTVTAVGAVLVAATFVFAPSAVDPFLSEQAEGSLEARTGRPAFAAELVADDPYLGLGFLGPREQGLQTTDLTYLLVYAELGVVGLVAFAVLLGTAALVSARALRSPPGTPRLIGSAAFVGVVGGMIGAAAFDFFSVQGSARSFWLMAALAIAVPERWEGPVAAGAVRAKRLGIALLILLPALALRLAAPTHAAQIFQGTTLPPAFEADAPTTPTFVGNVFENTACGIAGRIAAQDGDLGVRCEPISAAPGALVLRLHSPDPATLRDKTDLVADRVSDALPGFDMAPVGPPSEGIPTAARTAPVWATELALLVAVLIPSRRPRTEPRDAGGPARARPVPVG